MTRDELMAAYDELNACDKERMGSMFRHCIGCGCLILTRGGKRKRCPTCVDKQRVVYQAKYQEWYRSLNYEHDPYVSRSKFPKGTSA